MVAAYMGHQPLRIRRFRSDHLPYCRHCCKPSDVARHLVHLLHLEEDLFDPKMASFVLYGISYLLTLYLTVVLLEKFVWTFHIDEIKNVEFALQAIPFIFYIVVFSVFRDPKQLQYGAYALAYGLFVVWEWAENWGIASSLLTKIDTEFTLRFYIIPFKEAMLLFIILDTFFKARHESKAGKGAV